MSRGRNATIAAGTALAATGWLALRRAHDGKLAADPDRGHMSPLEAPADVSGRLRELARRELRPAPDRIAGAA